MVKLDINMPDNCANCPLNYDCVYCIVTEKRFWKNGNDPYEGRMSDCPLSEITSTATI